RVSVEYGPWARGALAIGRTALIGLAAFVVVELWLHAHFLFVFFGLSLLLAGPHGAELVLGRYGLVVTPLGGLFVGPSEVARGEIAEIRARCGGLWQAFWLELVAALKDGREVTLLPNLNREQLEFARELAERWCGAGS